MVRDWIILAALLTLAIVLHYVLLQNRDPVVAYSWE